MSAGGGRRRGRSKPSPAMTYNATQHNATQRNTKSNAKQKAALLGEEPAQPPWEPSILLPAAKLFKIDIPLAAAKDEARLQNGNYMAEPSPTSHKPQTLELEKRAISRTGLCLGLGLGLGLCFGLLHRSLAMRRLV
eukprot:155707-Chlamydomonas_euryale.AAC.1